MTDTRAHQFPGSVARVLPLVGVATVDRLFDYAIPPELQGVCQPGCRVRIRFAGRRIDGLVWEVADETTHEGALSPIVQMLGDVPVMPPVMQRVCDSLTERYAAVTSDVVRAMLPPRHKGAEQADFATPFADLGAAEEPDLSPWAMYQRGQAFVEAVLSGKPARAAWQILPGDDGMVALAALVCKVAIDGGGVVCVLPHQRQVDRLAAACREWLAAKQITVFTANLGPQARYRRFLAALQGQARLVIGTRSAVFSPVEHLRLLVVVDDGSDQLVDPRAPYIHAREAATTIAAKRQAALLFASQGRTAEVQYFVESGWVHDILPSSDRIRAAAPLVRATADSDAALARDPLANRARIPQLAFTSIREALARNASVLVQVPRAGYVPALACQRCRTPARCRWCGGPLAWPDTHSVLECRWCGRPDGAYRCGECGGTQLRSQVVGVHRTAEELGRAFAPTPIVTSGGSHIVDELEPGPARLVIATPGAEPVCPGGYGAAVLLDGWATVGRQDLRAWERGLRQWIRAMSLVQSRSTGATVTIVAEASLPPVQAAIRCDPVGFASSELRKRREVHLPPAVHIAAIDAPSEVLRECAGVVQQLAEAEVLGPVAIPASQPLPGGWDETSRSSALRLYVRVPATVAARRELGQWLRRLRQRKATGACAVPLRIQVDPIDIG
ncbi:primosomal protein N' [Corynebacterium choanae]|uniref:Probable replication restart protein PriA n=1 Tax=Corynebacterium choanae TaxID=1862358 RepID=A0A3G6J6Z9_9CORY|nr:primosomal protein N' [Corynebacterium choanae]AZA13649.1 Primosomal protein N' [Corynebacterium choanae]